MKKLIFIISLTILFIGITAFSLKTKEATRVYTMQSNAVFTVAESLVLIPKTPSYGKSYVGFKEAIGFKESQSRYFIVNRFGYLGKYQFGKSTLKTLGIYNPTYFLYNTKLQEKAFKANCSYNKWLLQSEIKNHAGTIIKGIEITESGILAAAHLAGAGSVRKFLKYKGKNKKIVDAFGTSIEIYLKKFAGYDTSLIIPSKRPNIT